MKIPRVEELIAAIPQHTVPLDESSERPLAHFRRGVNDAWNLLLYLERTADRSGAYPVVAERHARRLSALVLVAVVESFERYAKELIAQCIDHVAPLVLDDRLQQAFGQVSARVISAHFEEGSVGRALTESSTWLGSKAIHDALSRVLADSDNIPWQAGPLRVIKQDRRAQTLDTLFQLRHSIVHNVSVLTRSDAAKLRVQTARHVDAPRVLAPTKSDLLYAKSFLEELASDTDTAVEQRLLGILTQFHQQNASLFDPAIKAAEIAAQFGRTVTLLGVTRQP